QKGLPSCRQRLFFECLVELLQLDKKLVKGFLMHSHLAFKGIFYKAELLLHQFRAHPDMVVDFFFMMVVAFFSMKMVAMDGSKRDGLDKVIIRELGKLGLQCF